METSIISKHFSAHGGTHAEIAREVNAALPESMSVSRAAVSMWVCKSKPDTSKLLLLAIYNGGWLGDMAREYILAADPQLHKFINEQTILHHAD